MPIHTTSRTVNNRVFKIFFLCEDGPSLDLAVALKEKLVVNCRDQADIEADFCESCPALPPSSGEKTPPPTPPPLT